MKGTIKILVIILLVGILLAVTVPSEESYQEHLSEKYKVEESKGLKQNVQNALSNLSGNLTTEYENYVVIAKASHKSSEKDVNSIGVLGFWIDM